jgi:hypothetical protein
MAGNGKSPLPDAAEQDDEPVKDKTWADRAQVIIAGATAVALCVTIVVAWQGQSTVNRNSEVTLRQSQDAQLSTAITAIGSSDQAEEIAGLLLLTGNTATRFTLDRQTGEPPADVFADYTTALQILSGYLSSQGEKFLTDYSASVPFGRGYGIPAAPGVPLDVIYAADQIEVLLAADMESNVAALGLGERPAVDLANDELLGQPWTGVNFGWISAYLVGIDLRGASLEFSKWSASSDLSHAYLECADLRGADFAGANLSDADLRGADVQGADFRGADIKGALLTPLYGVATWSRPPPGITTLPVGKWNQTTCLNDRGFWHSPPSTSPPTAISSPKPTPR